MSHLTAPAPLPASVFESDGNEDVRSVICGLPGSKSALALGTITAWP
jgi:hypothetical protein